MESKRISQIFQQEVKKQIGNSVSKYLSTPIEQRQELEKNGVNLTNFIFENVYPLMANMKVKTILIVMEEGIGNMVMLTPSLKMLRHNNPRVHITVLCKEPAAQVIRGWDVIDNIITEFDNNYYDLCFMTIWSNNTKNTVGTNIQQHCKAQITSDLRIYHESIQYLNIADFLDGNGDICLPHCERAEIGSLSPDSIELEDLMKRTKLKVSGTIADYIVFGDTTLRNFGWDKKRWPYYVELAKLIKKKFPNRPIVLIGDKEDHKEAKEKKWPDNVILDYMGIINIPQLAELLHNSHLYIGNDTGPTHIAAAVGAKTYAIFGPTLVSKNKPMGKDVTIVNKMLPCSPCQYTERWDGCECMSYFTADEVYQQVFFPQKNKKKKLLLVGDFSGGALRIEHYIKHSLEKTFGYKVIPFAYREVLKKTKNSIDMSYELLNSVVQNEPDVVLICGGHQVHPTVINYINHFVPNTKIAVWYADNRGQVEPWFSDLSYVCHNSFWTTGDPFLLSQVFAQQQKPCEFLPAGPNDDYFQPIEGIKKDIDVLFVGIPHSPERVQLLDYLATNLDSKIKFEIYGDGNWPDTLKPFVKPGVFNKDYNKVLSRSKIVINQNILNNVPLYFSDRYFYPMATKSVGLNRHVPNLEDMFEDGKHMVFWKDNEECLAKINELLGDDKKRNKIQEEGYKLYKEKYTLNNILKQMLESIG